MMMVTSNINPQFAVKLILAMVLRQDNAQDILSVKQGLRRSGDSRLQSHFDTVGDQETRGTP